MGDDITSVLEVIGILAVAIGAGVVVSDWLGPGLGWIAGGLLLIVSSLVITALFARAKRSDDT